MARRTRLLLDTMIPAGVKVVIVNNGRGLFYKQIGAREFLDEAAPFVEDIDVLAQEPNDGFLLYYDWSDNTYNAGCRVFTYEQAVNHWMQRRTQAVRDDDTHMLTRALLFRKAVMKHKRENPNA